MSSAGKPLPEPHSSFDKHKHRYVQQVVQAFVQLAPLGGSGGLLIHFLLDQSWLQAILIFPVTVVSVIWAAYTESFIARLREIFSERGRQDADALMAWLGKLDRSLRWQISGFETIYLKCQALACRDYITEGLRKTEGIFIPMLEEVFVPLELGDHCVGQTPAPGQTIWNFLSQARKVPTYRRITILAGGGYGKTTLLRHLTYSYATRSQLIRYYRAPRLIPVLLYLRKWQTVLATTEPPDLPTLITQHYIPELPSAKQLKLSPQWADNLLRRGDGLVMIDGFDEVATPHRAGVSHWLSQAMADYPKSIFILTCRPAGYEDYLADRPPTTLYVKSFDRLQRQQFIQRWYFIQERLARGGRDTAEVSLIAEREAQALIDQIEQRSELTELAQNPLLLNMIATFHRFYPGSQLPHRRPELYQDICQMQLRDRPLAKGIDMILPAPESQVLLQCIALEMLQGHRTHLSKKHLESLAQTYLAPVIEAKQTPLTGIQQIVQVSEILVEREPDQYEFAHLSFQNYLAARQIQQLPQGEVLLRQHWFQAWWRETILLYAAQVNPTQLIQAACLLGEEAIPLAHACRLATRFSIDPIVVERLQDQRYQILATFLQVGAWREADAETYRLLMQTVGKEPGQILTPEELHSLSCDDLHRINQLWEIHSQGKFSLAVQKTIYLNHGGNLEDSYQPEVWKKFCHQIGWMKDGEYVLVDFMFDHENAPVGHLPLALLRVWFRWCAAGTVAGDGWGLFSRIGDCEL